MSEPRLASCLRRQDFEEARIPRVSRQVFDTYVSDLNQESYIYRIDYYDSERTSHRCLKNLFTRGHIFVNTLDQFYPKERLLPSHATPLIVDMIDEISNTDGKATKIRGLYIFLCLERAVEVQRLMQKTVSFVSGDQFRRSVPVLTRMRFGELPPGLTLPDPFPYYTAAAALHVVAQPLNRQPLRVKRDNIELYFSGKWNICSEKEYYYYLRSLIDAKSVSIATMRGFLELTTYNNFDKANNL